MGKTVGVRVATWLAVVCTVGCALPALASASAGQSLGPA